jgi:hypothetical protein
MQVDEWIFESNGSAIRGRSKMKGSVESQRWLSLKAIQQNGGVHLAYHIHKR